MAEFIQLRRYLPVSMRRTVNDDPVSTRVADGIVITLAWMSALVYAIFFSWLSIQRYDAFLPHALDLGNMDQAVWHTLHGQFFYFTNMRVPLPKEAWGTTTRLSFHVEPILLPLSLLYLVRADPQTLLVAQALVVSLGAPAAARLALRVTGSSAFALVATLAYVLSPALQAATLYEFHPVTLAASLLLWAIVFADERRYLPFIICCALAITCKEEIGLVVALLCVWLWWYGGDRRVAAVTAILAAAWSCVAIGLIVPHFGQEASPYWQRYIDAGAAGTGTNAGMRAVLATWLQHPEQPFLRLLWAPKLAMLQRWLASMGYLGLLGLPMLLVSAPSLAIILLSTDEHMYGGLGQYSAELVPIMVAAGIYGAAAVTRSANRWRIPPRLALAVCATLVLVLAGSNARLNGFSPLTSGYAAPEITAHDLLGQRLLRLIPPAVPVSAMDQLDPHLGDRAATYLFPDVGDARYVALDLTTNVNPGTAANNRRVALDLLNSRRWAILAADDGYLILRQTASLLPKTPVLPTSFFRFAVSQPSTQPALARFGDYLELVGTQIERREQVNLRVPDLFVTAELRVLRPLPADLQIQFQLTNTRDEVNNRYWDQQILDWLPAPQWPVGAIVRVQSQEIAIVSLDPGSVQLRMLVYRGKGNDVRQVTVPHVLTSSVRTGYSVVHNAVTLAHLPIIF